MTVVHQSKRSTEIATEKNKALGKLSRQRGRVREGFIIFAAFIVLLVSYTLIVMDSEGSVPAVYLSTVIVVAALAAIVPVAKATAYALRKREFSCYYFEVSSGAVIGKYVTVRGRAAKTAHCLLLYGQNRVGEFMDEEKRVDAAMFDQYTIGDTYDSDRPHRY